MARYIDAELIDLERVSDSICQWQAQEAIDDTPTADVRENVHAHWGEADKYGMFIINLMKIESRLADDIINEMFEYLKKRERENDGRNAEDDNWFCGDGERRTDDDRNG